MKKYLLLIFILSINTILSQSVTVINETDTFFAIKVYNFQGKACAEKTAVVKPHSKIDLGIGKDCVLRRIFAAPLKDKGGSYRAEKTQDLKYSYLDKQENKVVKLVSHDGYFEFEKV